jgi:glycosyltransferase involved in cell wall biosynthesis
LKLLFVSNLFPDTREPQRGLDNAALLAHLAERWEIRSVAVRPVLPWSRRDWQCRDADRRFSPLYVASSYVPKIGSLWNHRLMASALREPLKRMRTQFAFDVVLASWLYPDACAVGSLAAEQGFPFAAIAQGSDVHQYLAMPSRRRIMLSSLQRVSAIITRSGELARLLADAGFPRHQLHPIYNGIDFARFSPADQAGARRALALPTAAKIILFVGNFFAIKNPLLLVEAHARLLLEPGFADCRLVMVGGGPLEAEARALAGRLATDGRVIFAGRQDTASVARHMQAADVLCVPSRNEGVPNVILEAFACGLPVVAANVGGIPEVLAHDFLGMLVQPGDRDALAAGLRATLGVPADHGRIADHARQFSWDRTATAYDDLLQRAVR